MASAGLVRQAGQRDTMVPVWRSRARATRSQTPINGRLARPLAYWPALPQLPMRGQVRVVADATDLFQGSCAVNQRCAFDGGADTLLTRYAQYS
jgi:hypothetical protein